MNKTEEEKEENETCSTYRALVIDSGPIIRLNAINSLKSRASSFYTVPAVLAEIRDAKAREHLNRLPFELVAREPSPESIQAVIEFSRQTGDYRSLSAVDIQVLGLLYELECEGCGGDINHIRKTPKRTVGIGKIEQMGGGGNYEGSKKATAEKGGQGRNPSTKAEAAETVNTTTNKSSGCSEANSTKLSNERNVTFDNACLEQDKMKPKTWAMITNPLAAALIDPGRKGEMEASKELSSIAAEALHIPFGKINFIQEKDHGGNEFEQDERNLGQFSDAEDDEDQLLGADDDPEECEQIIKDDENSLVSENISDEECDVYILDPGELDQIQQKQGDEYDEKCSDEDKGEKHCEPEKISDEECDVYILDEEEVAQKQHQEQILFEEELQLDFPSLAASLHVPYEGEEDENNDDDGKKEKNSSSFAKDLQHKKKQALEPISRSGKGYNSFSRYGHLFERTKRKDVSKLESGSSIAAPIMESLHNITKENRQDEGEEHDPSKSRIIGGTGMSGQGADVDDDGEGWITTTKDIQKMKASGILDPKRNPSGSNKEKSAGEFGPPIKNRTACTTTDFAMQNVILQMNLELLSVDGIKVRRLKSWVTRCGACYKVYSDDGTGPNGMKRLFCEHCGSDMLQRIAASVDGKTGRLRLHMKKNYKTNLRGTKYSLPKPGTHNRFQGDLLLREDQLLSGAWNQKVKIRSGGKAKRAAQSMFGQDLATNVGCYTNSATVDDIKVGFGRRNPNATKGRERRGKKKKSKDKACGLRRYN